MKKYLMTGVAALAICAAFTSCSKSGEELYDAGKITQNEAAQIEENYNKAFVATFGQPAANQDWGFGRAVGTRSENANANEWADPNKAYGGLKVPPPLTDEQKAVVIKYFQITPNLGYEDPHWTNYFMQQVYKGHTSPREGYSPEAYMAANGSTYLYASDYMDHLAAIDGTFVDHINNFNHGDCSTNGTVLDNGGNANDGPFHSDKIMYMKESTTKSFGYYNSNGSVRRTEYTGLVSYKTIMKALGSEADCLEDGWNRSFMGFDFEQMVGPEIYAKELDYSAGWSADIPGGFPVKDYEWFEWKGQKYHMLVAEQNMYCGTPLDISDAQVQEDGFIDNLLSQGYLPVTGGASKKWVKVGGCADGYFSDWIVTLTEAKTGNTPPPSDWDIRIIAEDLNAKAADSEATDDWSVGSDWDFNDVVFDVKFTSATTADVKIVGAGGVYPLYVAGHEAHEALGQSGPDSEGRYKIQNSGTSTPFQVTGIDRTKNGRDISVTVVRTSSSGQQIISELKAEVGKPAAKIGVDPKFEPCAERQDIRSKYPLFSDWVQNNITGAWYQVD